MTRYKIFGLIFPFVLWEFLARFSGSIFVPGFGIVLSDSWKSIDLNSLWNNLSITVFKTLIAFVVANVGGLGLGYIFSLRKGLVDSLDFTTDFLRSLPVTALFPLAMIMFGLNEFSKTSLVAFGLFWIVLFSTIKAMQTLSTVKVNVFLSLGADQWEIFRHYVLYILLNNFVSAAKITLSMSLYITITFEMFIGSEYGIGKSIVDAKNYYEIPVMYFWIIMAGLIGYGLNKAVTAVENRLQTPP
jgi:ABC-type nitrate/sulfonate/bicarbonate transport system permease component